MPKVNLQMGPATARAVANLIQGGKVLSAHDISDGGLLCALAEMLIAGSTVEAPIGASIELPRGDDAVAAAFSEGPSRYLLEVDAADADAAVAALRKAGVGATRLGALTDTGRLVVQIEDEEATFEVEQLAEAWRGPLDW